MTNLVYSRRFRVLVVLAAVMAVTGTHFASNIRPKVGENRFVYHNRPTAEQLALSCRQFQQVLKEKEGGEHYKPLTIHVDFPGIDRPEFKKVSEVDVSESSPVVGIELGDLTYAFVLQGMIDPEAHIANMIIGETPISVSYCDLVDAVRVFTCQQTKLIPLHVGGLNIHKELVLLLDGKRYNQSSDAIPLSDYPFVRTSFGDWTRKHPSSRVYIAPVM
jgi:hypothetical protein